MALIPGNFGAADLAGLKNLQLVLAYVQKELKDNNSLLPMVTDVTSLKGGSTGVQIAVPRMGSFEAEVRACDTPATFQKFATAKDLLAQQALSVRYQGDEMCAKGIVVQKDIELAKRASSALSRGIDSAIITKIDSAAFATATVTNATLDEEIIEAKNDIMCKQGENLVILASCGFVAKMEQVYQDWSKYGINVPVMTGKIDSIRGLPVVMTSKISGDVAYIFSKDAVLFAWDMAPQYRAVAKNDMGVNGFDNLFETCIYIGHGYDAELGAASGKSPLIKKLSY